MDYSKLVETYSSLESTSKRLEKTYIISEFLLKVPPKDLKHVIYLLQGRIFPKWDGRKIGMGSRLVLKAISLATGVSIEKVEMGWAEEGDLGIVVEKYLNKKKQTSLFPKKLTTNKVFDNLRSLSELKGTGTVVKKISLVVELLTSTTPVGSKFIVRTILEKLRINVGEGVIRDSLVWAYLPKVVGIFFKCENCEKMVPSLNNCIHCGKKLFNKFNVEIEKKYSNSYSLKSFDSINKLDLGKYSVIIVSEEKLARKIYNYFVNIVQKSYDLTNDFGKVAEVTKSLDFNSLEMKPGIPLNPMLAIKSESVENALEAVGKPALVEYKLDGFRLQIHRNAEEVNLYTRRLENVTNQFKELVPLIKSKIKSKFFILDSEVIGYNPKTGNHLPFQYISKRIRRKYDIEKKSKEIPVEINVFDIMFYNGKNLFSLSQKDRRNILEKIVKQEKNKIVLTKKLISSNLSEIENFYKNSLLQGNEGIMVKNMDANYISGRKVGGWLKIKPIKETLDLVITSAEWGEGKRAKWLSSFNLSCRDKNKFLEVGKVATGFLEKEGLLSFQNITKILGPLILSQKGRRVILKPVVILEIAYEEIQKSKNYNSGYALRFPRVLKLRNDLGIKDVDSIQRISKFFQEYKK